MARSHHRRYYHHRNAAKSAGMSTGATVALVGLGVVVIGGIGYYLYQQSQAAQTAAAGAGGGTISSGQQSYQLGAGGSTTPLPTVGSPGATSDGSLASSTAYGPGYDPNAAPATYAGELG